MRTEIRRLLNIIEAETETQPPETLELSYLLEISHGYDRSKPEYQTILSEEQLKITLSPDEQDEIVRELLRLIDSGHHFRSSLIWIAGKSTANTIISLVHEYVLSHYTQMDDDLILQSIFAVQNGLFFASQDKAMLSKVRFADLQTMFETCSDSSHWQVSYQAKQCLESLAWYKKENYW